jgi:DNA-binding NarL/FixJ family response regulator
VTTVAKFRYADGNRKSVGTEEPQAAARPQSSPSEKKAVRPRVLIADDHRLVAAGLERLLATECEVVGTVIDSAVLLKEVRRLRPDVVVQDLSMPPFTGIDGIRVVREIDPNVKIIVVTMWDDPELAAQAFRTGASAYVLKNCAASELLDAVHCAMEQKSYVTPLIAGGMIDSLIKSTRDEPGPQLTTRQRAVLRLLAEGKSMKEVADELNMAVRTVAFHKYRMMRLLNIRTTAELVRFAVAQHIV